MADLKDKQIRLVGSKDFAYATGSNYTQGHVHFTTDEHGSIVVNGKVYGTTDAAYIYVGSENIPTYVANALNLSYAYTNAKINALDGNTPSGNGNFISYVQQENGKITAYKNTLQDLVTVNDSEAKAYAPAADGEAVKFIKSFSVEGDTIIPHWDYFTNNIPATPDVTVSDNNYAGYYLPEFSASGHTITVTNGAQVASYQDFSDLKKVVDTFFGGADVDTENLKAYIDTLAEIQDAFKNSYAESIANSVKSINISKGGDSTTAYINVSYTTHGNVTHTVSTGISYGTNTTYGLVKYDNNTIKKNANGHLYVDGKLTDTKYSLDAAGAVNGTAYISLNGADNTQDKINVKGTGIATVTYNSVDKAIEIYVPETEVNYNHHSTAAGTGNHNLVLPATGTAMTAYNIITSVSLSADGKLTYEYGKITHDTTLTGAGEAGPGSTKLSNGSILIPKISFNECGHITAYENVTISGIAAEVHSHDEFIWL